MPRVPPAFVGIWSVTVPVPRAVIARLFIRWFWLNEWVTDDNRIQVALAMPVGSAVVTVMVWP